MRKVPKTLAITVIGVVVAAASLVATTQTAAAAAWIDICNSRHSDTGVFAYSLISPDSMYIEPGECGYNFANGENEVRVDVLTSGSYRKTEAGAGWDVPCYDAPKTNSNPFGDRMYYRTWGPTLGEDNCP